MNKYSTECLKCGGGTNNPKGACVCAFNAMNKSRCKTCEGLGVVSFCVRSSGCQCAAGSACSFARSTPCKECAVAKKPHIYLKEGRWFVSSSHYTTKAAKARDFASDLNYERSYAQRMAAMEADDAFAALQACQNVGNHD